MHTPGPWTDYRATATRAPGVSVDIWHVNGDRDTTHVANGIYSEANARLIAAAPDLLAALEALAATARTFRGVPAEEQEWTPIDDEALDAAFAAIAQATGEDK
jgi:hypothetical protein